MQLVFSDAQYWEDFLPLSFTRPIAEIRCGILTFSERWQKILNNTEVSFFTESYLQHKYKEPEKKAEDKDSHIIIADINEIKDLKQGEALVYEDELVAAYINVENFSLNQIEKITDITEELIFFKKSTDLFTYNKEAIDFDFELLTKDKTSQELSSTNGFLGDKKDLFIEEGARVEFSTLNTKTGKIYIGKNAEVMEGCNLRGPIALCEDSKFNLGAKIYGATTIGPHSKVGGEVNNIVVFGYSNKGHSDNYMIGRFLAAAKPFDYAYDVGYHVVMSLITFASGGFFGVGLGNSIHKHMNFPNPSTDFITLDFIVNNNGRNIIRS